MHQNFDAETITRVLMSFIIRQEYVHNLSPKKSSKQKVLCLINIKTVVALNEKAKIRRRNHCFFSFAASEHGTSKVKSGG